MRAAWRHASVRSVSARTVLAVSLLAVLMAGALADRAAGHSGLLRSEPAPDSTLGASPGSVRLTFTEQPEASLSEIRVLDESETPVQTSEPEPVPGDPLTLVVALPQLPRGSYTVAFRAISSVDGHATAGAYAFGVGVPPTGVTSEAPGGDDGTSALELVARWALLAGLALVLGAAVAGLAGFAGSAGSEVLLAAAGWLVAVVGLVLLAVVQRDAAGSSLCDLVETPVGEALVKRAVAISVAGAGVVAALLASGGSALRRAALVTIVVGALATIAVHVDAGHAAATAWSSTVTVSAQVAHFAAAGVWLGGLAALLLGIRGASSAAKADAVRRFAVVAAAALLVVVVTGTLRVVDELNSVGELFSTGYGRAVLAKIALIAAIVAFAVVSRRRGVPRARSDLAPLRRTSRVELALAAAALAAAAVLGSLAPAITEPEAATAAGVSASGSDRAGTVEAELEAASDQPGPNTFTASVEDDSGEPVDATEVSLRFSSLDDPYLPETELALEPGPDATYVGTGSNLSLDGRWEVVVAAELEEGAVEVPLELDLPFPSQEGLLSVLRLPDRPPQYDLQVGDQGYIRVRVDPQRAGPNRVEVICYSVFQNQMPIERIVITAQAGDGEVRDQSVAREGPARFAADVELEAGSNTVRVIARAFNGIRLRGEFELEAPGD
jgi:copper transport protein